MTDDILALAKHRFQQAVDANRDNIEAGLEDLAFVAGHQWDSAILQERLAKGIPTPTINLTNQFVKQTVGDFRKNRPRIKVRPVDGSEKERDVADIFEGLIRAIERNSDADSVYIRGGDGAVKCGVGNWRVTDAMQDDDHFYRDLRIKPINNPFSVVWDADAREITRQDAMFCFVLERMSYDAFKEEYPDASVSSFDDFMPYMNGLNMNWVTRDDIQVAEYWYKKPYKKTIVQLESGEILDVTKEKWQLDVLPIKAKITQDSHKICRVLMSGAEILEKEVEWVGKYIPIIPIIGEEHFVGNEVIRHGIVRAMKDPQKMYNFMRGTQMQVMQQQLTAPYLATEKQIAGYEREWQNANQLNLGVLPYNVDPTAPMPQRQSPPVASSALSEQVAVCSEEMKSTTGIYDAALGNQSNETSGKAILARQSESDTSIAVYMDNLSQAIKHTGRVLVDLIPHYYTDERVIRILKEDGSEDIKEINKLTYENGFQIVMNDLSLGKYDVDIDSGASYNTKRMEAADSMMQFAQAVPNAAGIIGDLIAKNMDWPLSDAIAKRLRKTLPPELIEGEEDGEPIPPPPPPPPPNPKDVASAEKMQAETESIRLDNVQKELQLASMGGQMQQIVQQAIQQSLAQILGAGQQEQPPMQQPMPQDMMQGMSQQPIPPQGENSLPLGFPAG